MITLWDVLKASKGLPVSDFYAAMWGKQIAGKYTIAELEGALPLTLNANGEPLIDYRIYGNTEQTGTPTPENPIMPVGVGERTDNFWNFQPSTEQSGVTLTWNGAKIVFSGICRSSSNLTKSITLSAGTYTIKANANRIPANDDNSCVDVYKASPYMMAKISNRNAINGITNFTLGEETTVSLRIRVQADVNYDGFTLEPMLNLGSTALPYEPYGYKLPILSNSTVTNIYLGEVETTRQIKKVVLTGEETYQGYSYASTNGVQIINIFETAYRRASGLCNIYPVSTVAGSTSCVWIGSGGGDRNLYFVSILSNMGMSTVNEFKSYVQQQYAAGTPVTVWYVLAEPETGVVNEPLMKIGDYSDMVSMEQAGASIPTNKGTAIIDYDGTLKPSQMYIKYREVKND